MTGTALRDRSHADERGVALVELGIVLSLIILVVLAMFDFGKNFNDLQSLRQGVREVSRIIAVDPGGSRVDTQAEIELLVAEHVGLDTSKLTVGWAPSGGALAQGDSVRVCVRYRVDPLTGVGAPFLPSQIHADATFRVEKPVSAFPVSAAGVAPCT